MSGAVSGGDSAGGDGALHGDIACGGMCACSARSTGDDTDCRGGLAEVEGESRSIKIPQIAGRIEM